MTHEEPRFTLFEDLSRKARGELRATGIVYLLDFAGPTEPLSPLGESLPRIVGYWEAELDGQDVVIEAAPGFEELGKALSWARERASVVLLSSPDGTILYGDTDPR
ncbi:MAG: hypothetical protein ABR507_08000 [Actinomycetota bacterium]|nr:hypothetical protein [Actinomycetota bacterium]